MKRQIQARVPAHERGTAKYHFARVQDESYAQVKENTHIIEHTPVYDLVAFEKRLKQRKTSIFIKKIFSAISLLCMFSVTFSVLFLGE